MTVHAANYAEELMLQVEQELELSGKGLAHTDTPLICAWLLRCELEGRATADTSGLSPDGVRSLTLADNNTLVGSIARASGDTASETPSGDEPIPEVAAGDVAEYDPVAAHMPGGFGIHYSPEATEDLLDYVRFTSLFDSFRLVLASSFGSNPASLCTW